MLVLARLSTERKHSHARHTTFPRAKHTQNDHFVSYVRFNAILRVLMSCRGYIITYKHSCTRKIVGTEPWRGQKGSQRRPYLIHEPPYQHSSLCSVSFFFGSFFWEFSCNRLRYWARELFFLGRQPRACGRASKRETKKKSPALCIAIKTTEIEWWFRGRP